MADIPTITKWLEDVDDLAMFDRRVPLPLDAKAMETEWRSDFEGREPRSNYWFRIDDDQGSASGMAGLIQVSYVHGNALLPMFVARDIRGQGVGVRTRALLLDLAFDQLRLARITSLHRADNLASRKLNEACGFKPEGCIRNGIFAGGAYIDQMVHGLLAEEWRAHRDKLRASLGQDVVVTLGNKPEGTWSWPGIRQGVETQVEKP